MSSLDAIYFVSDKRIKNDYIQRSIIKTGSVHNYRKIIDTWDMF